MLVSDFRVGGDQELTADREGTVAFGFGNAGFLQQRQRSTACTDKHEFGIHGGFFAVAVQIGHGDAPGVVGIALDVADFMAQVQLEVRVFGQRVHQLVGDHAKVNVGTQRHAGRSNFLRRIAAVHHQRSPLFNLVRVF
ncbi:hypothetical protein D3C71_1388830 [compost metagenome]